MNANDFWEIMKSAQVSSALLIIAVTLSYFAFKLAEKQRKTSKSLR